MFKVLCNVISPLIKPRGALPFAALLAIACGAGSIVSAGNCTGMIEGTDVCTTDRACNIATNPTCLTKIESSLNKAVCTSVGALPADNCHDSGAPPLTCGARDECSLNTAGTECVTGNFLGTVQYQPKTSDGDCTVE